MGPFNDPILRQLRINELFNENRQLSGRPPMGTEFRLSDGFELNELPLQTLLGPMAGFTGMGIGMGMGMGGLGMGGLGMGGLGMGGLGGMPLGR
jgi:hypothetical protein